jgi:uncharacterized protein (DUF1800 family)
MHSCEDEQRLQPGRMLVRLRPHSLLMLGVLLAAATAVPAVAQNLTVSPPMAAVRVRDHLKMTAYMDGVPTAGVKWAANGVPGGNRAVGRISVSGRYRPPSGPGGMTVTLSATSKTDPATTASAAVTVLSPIPVLRVLSPNTLPLGPFTLQVKGSRFVSGAQVLWNGMPLATTFKSSMRLTATGVATQTGTVAISVANPGPEAISNPLMVTVTAGTPVPPTAIATPTAGTAATPSMGRTEIAATPTMEPTATSGTASTPTMVATATMGTASTATMTMMATATTPTMVPTATKVDPKNTAAPTTTAARGSTPTRTATAGPTLAVNVAPASGTLQPGASQQFQATVSGSANQGVTWKVNNMAGGDPGVGTITAAGLYTAPAAVPVVNSVTITAVSVVNGTTQGAAVITIQDPLAVTDGRFLDQATFGPTQQLTAHLAQIGIPAFLDEQFATPESAWPPLATAQRSDAIDAFFANALNGQDQLRQRVIFALSEVIVESMNKNTNGDEIVPWLQLLSRNAFGNYRTLLKELTLDASMGKFLDLANSGMSGAPNENYPREVMQLFSIGLYRLNLDGSLQLDGQNAPIGTYTQTDVQQLAKALTGWTYGNATGTPPSYGNFSYYPGPMLPVAAYHNKTAKTILGQNVPANQSNQQDLDAAIDIIFNHPNVGPFLATRLIRALVTSNPTPAYIARIAAIFNNNGSGGRGDMQAVIRGILLDPEARNDTPPASFGRLRTPMQHTIYLARALGLNVGNASGFAYLFDNMNEGMLDAASVFGHYSPSFHIPKTPLFGPEFQIFSASDAINRANWFYSLMYNPWPINPVLQPFVAIAGNAAVLVNAVDNALLFGRMAPSTRSALLTAIPQMYDNNGRVLTALYLTSMSGECLIQR